MKKKSPITMIFRCPCLSDLLCARSIQEGFGERKSLVRGPDFSYSLVILKTGLLVHMHPRYARSRYIIL